MALRTAALRTLFAATLVTLPALAGCGGDDDDDGGATVDAAPQNPDSRPAIDAAPDPDAATAALDCAGAVLPTVAADPVSVSGGAVTLQLAALGPKAGVEISAFHVGESESFAGPVVTNANGAFSISAPTGGVPVDAYFKATVPGECSAPNCFMPSYLYPQYPVFSNLEEATVPVFTESHLGTLSGLAQVLLEDGTGHMVVVVIDCEGQPVEGATVTAGAETEIVYLAESGFPDATRTTTSTQGVALVFNVTPGEVLLNASRGGVSWRENDVEAYADSITATLLAP